MPRFYDPDQRPLDFGYGPVTKGISVSSAPETKKKDKKDMDEKAMEPVRKTEAGKYDGLETQEQADWWNSTGDWK